MNHLYNSKNPYPFSYSDTKCDLWVGIVCEKPEKNAVLGELGAHIVGEGFKRIRDGDRFWYENTMDDILIKQIKSTTLADLIRRNTGAKFVQDDVFRYE